MNRSRDGAAPAANRDAAPARALPGRQAMRRALAATGCHTWLEWVAGVADAAEPAPGAWPTRPIRLLCPLGAGTSADGVARLIARGLGDALGQSVIVENRPGAATNIASELAARAPADGYTLLFGTSSLAILPATAGARAIDAERALAPVSILTTQPLLIAAPEIPTLAEAGLGGFDVSNWLGILAPAGTPADIVTRLRRELVQVLATPDVQSRLREIGFDIIAGTPAEFAQTLRQETGRWKSVVASAGLRFE